MTMKVLLVGGSRDGEWHEFEGGFDQCLPVQTMPPIITTNTRVEDFPEEMYTPMKWRGGNRIFTIFRIKGMDELEVVERLINNYAPKERG